MISANVGIAMSGGVDSTVSATLLQEYGHRVRGFYMLLPLPGIDEQVARVRNVADRLGVPLTLVDLRKEFSSEVIHYFLCTYKAGQTPNPCIRCNQLIKFGSLLDAMLESGVDMVSTGHYARVESDQGTVKLYRGADPKKDQSYFLCRLSQKQLRRLILPLGQWRKEQAYRRAAELGFDFQGQESQDVCFLPDGLQQFLHQQGVKDHPGDIIATDGTLLGRHRGIIRYTIGQRRGLGLPDTTPWYVVRLDPVNNLVVVGKNEELFSSSLQVHDMQWQVPPPSAPLKADVQLRSTHRRAQASIDAIANDRWRIDFTAPQRAITPGQFAVIYQGNLVIGSGVIHDPSETSSTSL